MPLSEEQRHGQRLELLGKLAACLAHDISNALTVIVTYADLLGGELGGDRESELAEIRYAARVASTLTRHLLLLSRRGKARQELLDVPESLERIARLTRAHTAAGIETSIVWTSTQRCGWLDPIALDQIVLNLAINARDAMPHGGSLAITGAIKESLAEGRPGEEWFHLSVRDTGMGMADETRHRAFEPYYTTKTNDEGTGLGLTIVQDLVHESGGTVTIDSAPGTGTCVSLAMPCGGRSRDAR